MTANIRYKNTNYVMASVLAFLTIFFASASAFADKPLILQPAISPNGKMIAFTYQGDIWTVGIDGGKASRLTIHEGYESNPKWHPDGKQIAFNSDRFGNNDIFIMPAKGGSPRRLTYHSAGDTLIGFANKDSVIFSTRRLYAQVERESEIYVVDIDGSKTESRFMDALGIDPSVSPNGNKVAFVRGTARTSREDYRGPANRNIWIFDIDKNNYEQLSNFAGTEFSPQWAGNRSVFYIAPNAGKYNVFKTDLKGDVEQLTSETDFGVNHFSVDKSGDTVVYQAGNEVYSFDVDRKRKKALKIDVAGDFRFDPEVARTTRNRVDEYAISPNGKLAAYVLRGDIYVTRNDKKDSRSVRLTQGAERDRDVTWLNDETLLFVSDAKGQNDIYKLQSADEEDKNLFTSLKRKITALTNTPAEETNPIVAPNSKRLVFMEGRGKLLSAELNDDAELSNQITLLDGWATPEGISWSPDSHWLAYSLTDLSFNDEIFIHAADNSTAPVNVSMHPKYDVAPVWSPDGSKLGFASMRNNGDFDIWFAWLNKSDYERSREEWRRIERSDKKPEKKDKKEKSDDEGSEKEDDEKGETSEEMEKIHIDFDGIYQRLEQVTRFAGNEIEFLFDQKGEHIYYAIGGPGRQNFAADRSLFKIKWNGEDKKTILKGDARARALQLADKGKSLYALRDTGTIVKITTKGDKAENLNVSSQQRIDYAGERAQVFDDAWRALNAGFYDPNFHGKDWDELREKYRPLALNASTKEDFQYIFNLMLGQLNASHMGLFAGENQKQTQRQRTGLLGIEGFNTKAGFEISSVLKGSPADRVESKLAVGDVITAINQEAVSDKNLYAMLLDQANNPVLLNIEKKQVEEGEDKSQEVVIWPVRSLNAELYDDWVEQRRKLTDKYSNGRLGYLHIRGMNWTSFERFERELMAAGYGKEGIVIDVRYNGGGWTTDYLMAVLNVKQHAYTIPRGAAKDLSAEHEKFKDNYPFAERLPLSAWTKPSIAMANENSYSNAEIFSHAYKALGIGKLVGRPTFGAVISTGGYRLVDGSLVRMPFRGWWVKESGQNMDFTPAVPDIEVFNPPAYKARGIDPQLQRAVEELLGDL